MFSFREGNTLISIESYFSKILKTCEKKWNYSNVACFRLLMKECHMSKKYFTCIIQSFLELSMESSGKSAYNSKAKKLIKIRKENPEKTKNNNKYQQNPRQKSVIPESSESRFPPPRPSENSFSFFLSIFLVFSSFFSCFQVYCKSVEANVLYSWVTSMNECKKR